MHFERNRGLVGTSAAVDGNPTNCSPAAVPTEARGASAPVFATGKLALKPRWDGKPMVFEKDTRPPAARPRPPDVPELGRIESVGVKP